MNVEMRPNGPFGPKGEDAIDLLEADHRRVQHLFYDIAKLGAIHRKDERRVSLVNELCSELKMHAVIEETIFYPAVRAIIDDANLVDEARAQHAAVDDLITQLEATDFTSDLYDAIVAILQKEVSQHIQEEEEVMFVKASAAKLDGVALGDQMAQRKAEMMVDTNTSATALKAAHIQDALRKTP